jgi:ParB-like chromosome segregation protein Spo0J
MSRSASPPDYAPVFSWIDIDLIEPNPWNPNVMDSSMYAAAIESIHEFGFVDPITVRRLPGDKIQIIDGEHRLRAARDHGSCIRAPKGGGWERHAGLHQLPVTDLGSVPDEDAKQLTIVLNETRGSYDPKRMGKLLVDLVAIKPLPELATVLPFDRVRIEELAELPTVDWQNPSFKPKSGRAGPADKWVERVYRLPEDAANALDKAIQRCREDEGMTDAQAIQSIAEHFLRE